MFEWSLTIKAKFLCNIRELAMDFNYFRNVFKSNWIYYHHPDAWKRKKLRKISKWMKLSRDEPSDHPCSVDRFQNLFRIISVIWFCSFYLLSTIVKNVSQNSNKDWKNLLYFFIRWKATKYFLKIRMPW